MDATDALDVLATAPKEPQSGSKILQKDRVTWAPGVGTVTAKGCLRESSCSSATHLCDPLQAMILLLRRIKCSLIKHIAYRQPSGASWTP